MNRSPLFRPTLALILCFLAFSAAVSNAQPVNIRASNEDEHDPEEVSIAVSPSDTNLIAIGANLNYLFTSSDAGGSWHQTRITSEQGVWGDPALAFDGKNLYYVHLAGNVFGDSATWLRTMIVQNSSDLGATWSRDTGLANHFPKQQDKPTLVEAGFGVGAARHKRMLLSWTQFDHYASHGPSDSSHILLTQEVDGVWQDPVRIDDTGGTCIDDDLTNEGAVVAGGKNGEIYVAWCLNSKIYFDRSLDGSLRFGKDKIIAAQPGGWDFSVPGLNRANGFPSIAFDTSIGRMYVQWSDQHEGYTNIYMIYSDDKGETWSPMQKVNTDAVHNHHFYSSMAIDRVTGHLGIVYYAFDSDTGQSVDVYLARSRDHGATWTNEKISTNAFTPSQYTFFGDYIGIAATGGNFYPVWMRIDGGSQIIAGTLSVWTAIIRDTVMTSAVKSEAPIDRLWVTRSAHGSIAFDLRDVANVRIETTDALGRTSEVLLSGNYAAGQYQIPIGSAPGVRFLRMTVDRNGASQSYFAKYVN